MLKKYLSSLPFNPSLIDDLPDLISKAESQRKLKLVGLFIMLYALIIQLFIVIFPAQPTIAFSPNDLIEGGFSTRLQITNYCNHNYVNYHDILKYFNLTCNDLNSASVINTSFKHLHKTLYSINRLQYNVPGQQQVIIKCQSFWLRSLNGPSVIMTQNIEMLHLSKNGNDIYIPFNSADLLFTNKPQISNPTTCNSPELAISLEDRTQNTFSSTTLNVNPGDHLIYTLTAYNPSSTQTIQHYIFSQNVGSVLSYSRLENTYNGIFNPTTNILSWQSQDIFPNQTATEQYEVVVDNPLPLTPVSITDPNYYSQTFTSSFGNIITSHLPLNFTKFIELSDLSFRDISPNFGFILESIIFLLFVYLYARSDLLVKELKVVKKSYKRFK